MQDFITVLQRICSPYDRDDEEEDVHNPNPHHRINSVSIMPGFGKTQKL